MLPSDENTPAPNMPPAPGGPMPANPLQQPYYGAQQPTAGNTAAPQQQQTPLMNPLARQPSPALAQHQTAPQHEAEETELAAWIERIQHVVADTQNDPYKRMQMLQHLQTLYQKEKLGIDVAEEGRS